MTAVSDLHGNGLSLNARLAARRFRDWITRRVRPVLPLYAAERPTWWVLLRRGLLLAGVCFIALLYGLLVSILPPFMLVPAAAPPAILLLVVIWALPEAPNPPSRTMGRLLLAFSVLLLLWPNYLAFSFGGLPWISMRRLLGAMTVLLLLVSVSISSGFRNQMRSILNASPWLKRLVLGFIAVMVISTFTSTAPGETINRFVDILVGWIGMFFIALWYFAMSERRPERWVSILLWSGAALIVIGAVEYRVQHVLWAEHIPSFLRVQDEAVQRMLSPQFRDRYRVVTTFSSPLSYGEFLALLAPLVLHRLVNARGIWRTGLWCVADLVLLVSAFLSGARLSMVGFLVAHIAYGLLWGIRRWRMHKGGLIGPAVTMMYPAITIALFILIMSVDGLRMRVFGGGASQQSNDARVEQFHMAVPAVARRPLFGYGPGEGGGAIGWHTMGGQVSVDSGYLSIAADYGLLGFLLFYGAIVLAIVQLARSGLFAREPGYPLRLAVATMFVVLMNTRMVLSQTDNNSLVFIMLGLTFALLYRDRGHAAATGRG